MDEFPASEAAARKCSIAVNGGNGSWRELAEIEIV